MDELWDNYLKYLIYEYGLDHFPQYGKLFDILHHMEFVWFIDRDDNREDDGVRLRDDYKIPYELLEYEDEFMDHWCSVLEMLIALAVRVEDEFIGDPNDEHPESFILEMLNNLELCIYKGYGYRKEDVIKIVDRWLNRRFKKDGYGSPFPVKYDPRDQRKMEIWDQMNSYISENYA